MSPSVRDSLANVITIIELAGLPCEQEGKTVIAQCPVCGRDGDDTRTMTARADFGRPSYECSNGCDQAAIHVALSVRNDPKRPVVEAYRVTWTDDKTPKLLLPGIPLADDMIALASWVTSVFRLDPTMPVLKANLYGTRGQDGLIVIRRAVAPEIRFEPAGLVNSARRLLPALAWQLEPTDEEPYGFKDDHCRRIAHVIRLMCGAAETQSEQDTTEGIIGRYVQSAKRIEGRTTHGTGAQRYEAAQALSSEGDGRSGGGWGQAYLVDSETGEIVIRVSDLQETARREEGASLPRGWLDGRIEAIGWKRRKLDGHAAGGRDGRTGSSHARVSVYVGRWPLSEPGLEVADAA